MTPDPSSRPPSRSARGLRRAVHLLSTLLALVVAIAGLLGPAAPVEARERGASEVVVRPARGRAIAELARRHGAQVAETLPGADLYLLRGPDDLLEALRRDGSVEIAERNATLYLPLDQVSLPLLDQVSLPLLDQVSLPLLDQVSLPLLDAIIEPGLNQVSLPLLDAASRQTLAAAHERWRTQAAFGVIGVSEANTRARGRGIKVAVVDGGVAFNHPLFRWLWAHETEPDGYHGGFSRVQLDMLGAGTAASSSSVGHGTFVASLIAGVAPSATIMSVRVADERGQASAFRVAAGIVAAAASGADVINVSLSSPDSAMRTVREAVDFAERRGALVVGSAGNAGVSGANYPARWAFGVGATTLADTRAAFSNYGSGVDLAAPGVDVYGLYTANGRPSLARWQGTSFASALVSGAAALARQRHDLKGSALGDVLRRTGRSLPESSGLDARLDVARAVGAR